MNYNAYSAGCYVGQVWCGSGLRDALNIAQRAFPLADVDSVERADE